MDIVFNHCVGITALCNGQAKRLRFGSNEKVANVTLDAKDEVTPPQNRSHHDIVLANGTVLKSVPVSAFRIESSHEATTKRGNAKAETSPAASK